MAVSEGLQGSYLPLSMSHNKSPLEQENTEGENELDPPRPENNCNISI